MKFIDFLVSEDEMVLDQQKHYRPYEIFTSVQWHKILDDEDFKRYILKDHRHDRIFVTPDSEYKNVYDIGSADNVNYAMRVHITKRGKFFRKDVMSRVDGNWHVIRTINF